MNFDQVKLFCSECILRNIIRLHIHRPLSGDDMKIINEDFKNNILAYMSERYPMTGEGEVNKKLSKSVKQIDNVDALSNDLLIKSGIIF